MVVDQVLVIQLSLGLLALMWVGAQVILRVMVLMRLHYCLLVDQVDLPGRRDVGPDSSLDHLVGERLCLGELPYLAGNHLGDHPVRVDLLCPLIAM